MLNINHLKKYIHPFPWTVPFMSPRDALPD